MLNNDILNNEYFEIEFFFQKEYHWTNGIAMYKVLAFSPKSKLYVCKHVSVTTEI